MKKAKTMKNTITHGLLFGALFLGAGLANAQDVYLCAEETTKALPDGSTVPMWGYAVDEFDLSSANGCQNALGEAAEVTAPGPMLTPVGGALNISLTNNLPEPTSIVIPGQAMPAVAEGMSPVWSDGSSGPRTSPLQRVRSFGAETAPAATGTYAFTGLDAGTLMYHSGTHPQKQLYMGLAGGITGTIIGSVDGVTGLHYDNDISLFYSEIDPELNMSIWCSHHAADVACTGVAAYETSIHYHAVWFLINGEPYVDGFTADIPAGDAGQSTLLRFLSAAGETHVPILQGMHMSIVAEDGNTYTWQTSAGTETAAPREQYSVMLPPLKTKDAIIQPAAGRHAVYDGNGYMTNPSDPADVNVGDTVGGMLRFLTVGAGADTDLDGVPDAVDNCPVDANADQLDTDGDGIGDVCDTFPDMDGDGIEDSLDACPLDPNNDIDGDGICGDVDPFPNDPDNDIDVDGIPNPPDNCPIVANSAQDDTDGDGVGDACNDALDADGDEWADTLDNCPAIANPGQEDSDGDGIGDACEVASSVPVAVDDPGYSVNEDAILTVSVADGVLNNDTGGGGPLTANIFALPGQGTVTLNSDGSFTYDSNADFFGTDSFTYQAFDGPDSSSPATVTITVNAQNDAPLAAADTFFLTQMGPQSFATPGVLGNDNDVDLMPFDPSQLSAVLDADVNRGTLNLSITGGNWDGGFDYDLTLNNTRVGVVTTFDYHAFDGAASSGTVTATLRRELSVATATCEYDAEVNECAWVIEGRSAAPNRPWIEARLNGVTLIGRVRKGNGPNWGIDVQGSSIVPGAGDTVTVVAVGQPNGLIEDFLVTTQ